jgi:RNA polymerase sigma-70 factor (ECF subfamily)
MAIDIEAYYQKYLPMVLRRCRSLLGNEEDALDAAQDVFVRLMKAERRLHGSFPSSLLYTIATNTCLNRIRWRKLRRESSPDDPEEAPLISVDSGFDHVEARMILDTILETESESTRAICFMYHADGMTLKEIGEVVGLSISGVRKRLAAFSARARINYEGGNKA